MTRPRIYAGHTTVQIGAETPDQAILCLPVGLAEQRGPHLPLATDTIVAEYFAAALADRHEIWPLPAVLFGVSLEHALGPWNHLPTHRHLHHADTAAGRRVPASHAGPRPGHHQWPRRLYELAADHELAACVLQPAWLTTIKPGGEGPDVHAGIGETSLMLHIATELVNLAALSADDNDTPSRAEAINRVVRDRGVT